MQKIKMEVNEKKLIATLKDAFTNDYSVITELAQNARRAGATKVTFKFTGERDYDEHNASALESEEEGDAFITMEYGKKIKFDLVVTDNGKGITDMQSLLSVASSGWDEETIEADAPFGMGFLIAIYSSESVTVESKSRIFSATRKQLLNLEDITVTEIDNELEGTSITLKGITLENVSDITDFNKLVTKKLRAFGIDVYTTNHEGKDIRSARVFSTTFLEKDGSGFVKKEVDIGYIYYKKGLSISANPISDAVITFQGLSVGQLEDTHNIGSIIINLNNSVGSIRLPDRDSFINNAVVKNKISNTCTILMCEYIFSKKDDYHFLCKNYKMLKTYRLLHLLNDHNEIPAGICDVFREEHIEDYGNKKYAYEDAVFISSDNVVSRDDTESTYPIIISVDDDTQELFDIGDSNNTNAFALVQLLEDLRNHDENGFDYVLINTSELDCEHWAVKKAIPFEDLVEETTITITNKRRPNIDPVGVETEVDISICDSFVISVVINEVTHTYNSLVSDYVLYDDDILGTTVCLTPTCSDVGIVNSICCFQDEHGDTSDYIESQMWTSFSKWLDLEKASHNPSLLLEQYLHDLTLLPLAGKEFKLVIDKNGNTHVTLTLDLKEGDEEDDKGKATND